MKTIMIRCLLLAGVASLTAFSSRSQINTTQQVAYSAGGSDAVNMDYLKVDLSSLKNYISSEKANHKILRYFMKHFENAGDIAWGKVDDNVLAEFAGGDVKTRALFDKNGNLIYTIAYSDEKLLPQNYRQMIHNFYAGYTISQVSRVNEALREIWVVKLEAPEKLLAVRIENDQMEEVENFQRTR